MPDSVERVGHLPHAREPGGLQRARLSEQVVDEEQRAGHRTMGSVGGQGRVRQRPNAGANANANANAYAYAYAIAIAIASTDASAFAFAHASTGAYTGPRTRTRTRTRTSASAFTGRRQAGLLSVLEPDHDLHGEQRRLVPGEELPRQVVDARQFEQHDAARWRPVGG